MRRGFDSLYPLFFVELGSRSAGVAQLVEHVIGNDGVGSSILPPETSFWAVSDNGSTLAFAAGIATVASPTTFPQVLNIVPDGSFICPTWAINAVLFYNQTSAATSVSLASVASNSGNAFCALPPGQVIRYNPPMLNSTLGGSQLPAAMGQPAYCLIGFFNSSGVTASVMVWFEIRTNQNWNV